ncbi:MAG: SCP-like extracellular [Sphingomonadales bacterium]|nr:SCP-like extracellular [Sphingomonadales bacterium]
MAGTRLKSLAAAGMLALLAPLLTGTSVATASFESRVLAMHNVERARMGVAPLRWDPALAASAQRWADQLAASGRFEHAPENRMAPEGENLWAGTRGYFAPEAMVDAWIREKKYFRPGVFPDNSTTGEVEDVGHYTQLVWRATGEVGCAKASSSREDILVCRYAEAGNYIGERPL